MLLPLSSCLKWYEKDLKRVGKEKLLAMIKGEGGSYKTFDVDEFFQAAINRSKERARGG